MAKSTWDLNNWAISPQYVSACAKAILEQLRPLDKAGHYLDLGCGRGVITQAVFNLLPQQATLVGVDIEEIVPKNSESKRLNYVVSEACSFVRSMPDSCFDGVILKQMFHLVAAENRPELLNSLFRTQKKDASSLIFIMPPKLTFPMFKEGVRRFELGQLDYKYVIELAKQAKFTTSVAEFRYDVNISKTDYEKLLRQRFMSHLHSLTEIELENGLQEFSERYAGLERLEFQDLIYIIKLRK